MKIVHTDENGAVIPPVPELPPEKEVQPVEDTTTWGILKSGWGLFLAVVGVVSVVMDVASPSLETNIDTVSIFGTGSMTLGWLFIVGTFVLPVAILRQFCKKTCNRVVAVVWCAFLLLVWSVVHASSDPSRPARPNLAMLGGLVLCWRLLTWAPVKRRYFFKLSADAPIQGSKTLDEIRAVLGEDYNFSEVRIIEDRGQHHSVLNNTIGQRMPGENSEVKPESEVLASREAVQETAEKTPDIQKSPSRVTLQQEREINAFAAAQPVGTGFDNAHENMSTLKKRILIGGLFAICAAVAIYSLDENDPPSLSWTTILCGMWSAGVWLWPTRWDQPFFRNCFKWSSLALLAGSCLGLLLIWYEDGKWKQECRREAVALKTDCVQLADAVHHLQFQLDREREGHKSAQETIKQNELKMAKMSADLFKALSSTIPNLEREQRLRGLREMHNELLKNGR